MLGQLIESKLVQPLNHSYIPNITQAWPDFTNPFYDQGWQYTVPYTIYTTGIAWRKDLVDENPYREYTVGPVHGFTGAIGELDSREGASHGVLTELGAGQGIVGGGGATATVNNRSGNVGFGGLIFAGVGAHSDIASASAGVVGFGPKNIGVGIYGELFIDNVGGGGGAYINISTIGNCR